MGNTVEAIEFAKSKLQPDLLYSKYSITFADAQHIFYQLIEFGILKPYGHEFILVEAEALPKVTK